MLRPVSWILIESLYCDWIFQRMGLRGVLLTMEVAGLIQEMEQHFLLAQFSVSLVTNQINSFQCVLFLIHIISLIFIYKLLLMNNQDSMSTGCKCPPGFKGDGLTCEGKGFSRVLSWIFSYFSLTSSVIIVFWFGFAADINECKQGLVCQCSGCKCKNTWGGHSCSCSGDRLTYTIKILV